MLRPRATRPRRANRTRSILVAATCALLVADGPVLGAVLNLSASGKLDEFEVAGRLGVQLLDALTPGVQPVQWYGRCAEWPVEPGPRRLVRPEDVKDLTGASLSASGREAELRLPASQVREIRFEKRQRLVIELDKPAFYQVTPLSGGVRLVVQSRPGELQPVAGVRVIAAPEQTVIEASGPQAGFYSVSTLALPPRLVVEWQLERERSQALGAALHYREWQLVWEGQPRRVHVLTFVPRRVRLALLGTAGLRTTGPLSAMADSAGAWGAINGSFFNRNTQEALGALRTAGNWWSGPVPGIPARGTVAWSDQALVFNRLRWQATVRGPFELPIGTLNSSLTGIGLALYTPAWGPYQPQAGERTMVVRSRQVQPIATPMEPLVAPEDGLLLVARGEPFVTRLTELTDSGAALDVEITTDPPALLQPSLLAAGPLLVKDGRVVLDAEVERFRPDVRADGVARTVIARTAGYGLFVVVERGPQAVGMSLEALARFLTTKLAVIDALNLDGGGSSALYLGGHLRDREEGAFERSVHNGLGLWLRP